MILTSPVLRANIIVSLILVLLASCGGTPETIVIEGRTMGTTYSVKALGSFDRASLERRIDSRLKEVNQLMSTYIGDSEISQLNQLKVSDSMALSRENLQMLSLATRLNQQSNGKFDVTIGPLIELWGFGADPSRTDVPEKILIEQALERTGLDALVIENDSVMKKADTSVDFSAIAKGYGVDELARLVEEAGSDNYLVEIGGELRARGLNNRGRVWRIGIETPDEANRVPFTAIPLKNLAMATSGDYRNYFEVDGKRFSHTLDPSTGYPITHQVASVTVLAENTAEADGYATAINVMGEEPGLAMAEELNLLVMVIIKTDAGFETRTTSAFDRYLVEQTPQ